VSRIGGYDDYNDDDFEVETVRFFLTERILRGIPISGCAVGDAEKSLVDIASGDFLGLSMGN
jgi:hypothetical protein